MNANQPQGPEVAAAVCPDYAPDHCAAAVERLAELCPALQRIQPGQRVLLKVNLVTGLKPERAGTTHPALVSALSAWLRDRGVSVTIGDGPGGAFTKAYLDGVYALTGMRRAAAESGAALNGDFRVAHAEVQEARVLKRFDYTAWLDAGDCIINFCKLKSHGMMGLSCAVKNMFGAIPGLTKPAYHYRFPNYADFADMLIDLNEHFRPVLNLADAVVCMEGNGPTAGTPRRMGLLLASESPYALDLAAARLIGLEAGQIPTLERACQRGLAPGTALDVPLALGEDFPETGETESPWARLDAFRLPDFQSPAAEAGMEAFLSGQGFLARSGNRIVRDVLAVRPRLTASQCVGCKRCAGLCPVKAITMQNGKPRIDRAKCIRCFCCQEFCPAGALQARRSRLGDALLRWVH